MLTYALFVTAVFAPWIMIIVIGILESPISAPSSGRRYVPRGTARARARRQTFPRKF